MLLSERQSDYEITLSSKWKGLGPFSYIHSKIKSGLKIIFKDWILNIVSTTCNTIYKYDIEYLDLQVVTH